MGLFQSKMYDPSVFTTGKVCLLNNLPNLRLHRHGLTPGRILIVVVGFYFASIKS